MDLLGSVDILIFSAALNLVSTAFNSSTAQSTATETQPPANIVNSLSPGGTILSPR